MQKCYEIIMLKIEIKMVLNQRWIYLVKPVQPKAKRCKHVSSKENEPKDEFPGINEDSDEGIDFASEKALKGENETGWMNPISMKL